MLILSRYPHHRDEFRHALRSVVPDTTFLERAPDDIGFAEAWRDADVFLGWPLFNTDDPALQPDAGTNLRWVQTTSAGIASINGKAPEHWTITTAAGVFGPTIAEHVLGLLLYFRRNLHLCSERQRERVWGIGDAPFVELAGQTLLMLGLGDIGRNVAQRAAALGVRVVGVRREPSVHLPPGVERVVGLDQLDDELPAAHVVVAALPGTRHTRGLLDARRLGLMRDDAGFINVGRGSLVDHDALATQLESRPRSWAGLDVTHPEPLPTDHALWGLPNVLITPHLSGSTDRNAERIEALFLENLRHFAGGDLDRMRNRFDPFWEY